MKQISHWAAAHLWPARVLLVSTQFAMLVLALAAGAMLHRAGVSLPGILFWLAAGAAVAAAVLYPQKSSPHYKLQFVRRKLCDFTLAMCSFVMVLGWAGEAPLPLSTPAARAATISTEEAPALTAPARKQSRVGALMHRLGEGAKRLYHRLDDTFDGLGIGWQITLIVLLVAVGIALAVLLGGVACGIACNGAEALAALVLIFGWTGIVIGEVFGIRAIIRHGKHYKGRFRRD